MCSGFSRKMFVIGYPKSGNTWLIRLLSDLLDSPIINDTQVLSSEKRAFYSGSWKLIKAHGENKYFSLKDINRSDKVIYIVRDFRDVLISAFFFNNKHIEEDWVEMHSKEKRMFYRQYFRHEIKRMNKKWVGNELTEFLNVVRGIKGGKVGNWSEHVRFGLSLRNVGIVRYEDLQRNCAQAVGEVLGKQGIEYNKERLLDVIERQSFKNRKSQFQNSKDSVNTKFLRKGVVGDWRRFLDKDLNERIIKSHGNTFLQLGYEI